MLRGGSWGGGQYDARAVQRNGFIPNETYLDIGFRVVLGPPPI